MMTDDTSGLDEFLARAAARHAGMVKAAQHQCPGRGWQPAPDVRWPRANCGTIATTIGSECGPVQLVATLEAWPDEGMQPRWFVRDAAPPFGEAREGAHVSLAVATSDAIRHAVTKRTALAKAWGFAR